MFSEYFAARSADLQESLARVKRQKGIATPGKEREKDLNQFKDFYSFLRDHLPEAFSLATGKVRGQKHILNRSCDVLIYDKWCPKFLEMAGGYVLVDRLFAAMTLEAELTTNNLVTHAALTNALKSLYQVGKELEPNQIVPMFSILVAFDSKVPLMSHKTTIMDASREREIPVTAEMDMVCVLGQGLLIKDWENGGEYKVVETGNDTLMWFYILLLEYLDRDDKLGLNLREYIKSNRSYKEY